MFHCVRRQRASARLCLLRGRVRQTAAAKLLSRDEARQWQPKVIAEMNEYQFKVVKLKGDFVWHDHKHTDETFIAVLSTCRVISRSRKCGQWWRVHSSSAVN